MKQRLLFICIVLMICLLAGTASASSAGDEVYRHTVRLDDLTYTNSIVYSAAGSRLETFMLETELDGDVYPIVMACDTIYGGMTIPSVVKYAESQGYNVVAAINSDYFNPYAIPIGLVVEDGVYKSSPEGNNAVAFLDNGRAVVSERPTVTMTLNNERSGQTLNVTHYNKLRADTNGLYLFSEYFSTVSTRTTTDGWMVRFDIVDGELKLGETLELEVTELIQGHDAQPIGEGQLILTAAAASNLIYSYRSFTVGDRVTLSIDCSDAALEDAQWATGVGDVLISNGQATDSSAWKLSTAGKSPRSALGIRADGSVVALVADGRRAAYSNGLTVPELIADLRAQGCVAAVNMDGGGSAALGLRMVGDNGAPVVSSPSDGTPRSCSTYILFVTDARSNGKPYLLGFEQNGAMVYVGSDLELDYTAADSAFNAVTAPTDIMAAADLGTVSGSTYTAGRRAGWDKVQLSSATASGNADILVVDTLSALSLTADGQSVTSLRVEPGQSVQLQGTATRWGRPVSITDSAFSYAVSGGVGTLSSTGLFTAGTPGSTGELTVSAGGISAAIKVKVKVDFADIRGHWAEQYIKTLADKEIVGGVTGTTFAPEAGIKRGDFMLMLYRAAGSPTVSGSNRFSDVAAGSYYEQAVIWAATKGIAQGDGSGHFQPEANLTREQGVTFLYRVMSALSVNYADGDLSLLDDFSDAEQLHDYAKLPTATLVSAGVLEGSGGKLSPQAGLTRAQMAKLLCVMLKWN